MTLASRLEAIARRLSTVPGSVPGVEVGPETWRQAGELLVELELASRERVERLLAEMTGREQRAGRCDP